MTRAALPWVEEAVATVPPLATIEEVGRLLRCSRRSIYRLTTGGRLRAVRDGARLLVPRAELRRFLGEMGTP